MKIYARWIFRCSAALVTVVLTLPSVKAQTVPAFDISTIKPHDPSDLDVSVNTGRANLRISNMTAQQLIAMAWNVRPWLVSGLPAWGKSDHFEVNAKVSEPDMRVLRALSAEDRGLMVQNLLKDRFHLAVHAETRVLPVYELSVAPEGAKLKPSAALPIVEPGQPAPKRSQSLSKGDSHLVGKGITIRTLADSLANNFERYIVDDTGLSGDFDIELNWTPDSDSGAPGDAGIPGESAPPLATAIRKQLGLRLTPSKGPVPTIVVDHIEVPTDN
jgi:uncharacterized protein (TIGR03435 family)